MWFRYRSPTGLGLVALAEVRKVAPKLIPLESLQALGRFALFLQKGDGSFIQLYRSKSGPDEHFQSPYYPGEAALGFISLYEADHSREWLAAAGKALAYLANSTSNDPDGQLDQWALVAISKLIPYCSSDRCPGASRRELSQYAVRVCNQIVHEQLKNPSSPLDGAFDPLGETAPAAARVEGLLAVLEYLPKGELRARVEQTAAHSIAFLLRAQIKTGRFAGGIPGALRTSALSSVELRIDYVQHALSACLQYQKVSHSRATPRGS